MTTTKPGRNTAPALIGPLLVAIGTILLWLAHAGSLTLILPLAAVAMFASAAARLGWMRPATDLAAWAAVVALFATMGTSSSLLIDMQTLILTILAAATIITGAHVPPGRSASPAPTLGLLSWTAAVALVALAIWWPALRSIGDNIIVWDPLTPAGAALRILGLLLALALVAGITTASILVSNAWKERETETSNATSSATPVEKRPR